MSMKGKVSRSAERQERPPWGAEAWGRRGQGRCSAVAASAPGQLRWASGSACTLGASFCDKDHTVRVNRFICLFPVSPYDGTILTEKGGTTMRNILVALIAGAAVLLPAAGGVAAEGNYGDRHSS